MKHISKLCGLALALAMTSASAAYGQVSDSIDVSATIVPKNATLEIQGTPGNFGQVRVPASGACIYYIGTSAETGPRQIVDDAQGTGCEFIGDVVYPNLEVLCLPNEEVNVSITMSNINSLHNEESIITALNLATKETAYRIDSASANNDSRALFCDVDGNLFNRVDAELAISENFEPPANNTLALATFTAEVSY